MDYKEIALEELDMSAVDDPTARLFYQFYSSAMPGFMRASDSGELNLNGSQENNDQSMLIVTFVPCRESNSGT